MALPKRRRDQKQIRSTDGQPDWHTFYDVENPAEVDKFVAQNDFLSGLLRAAPAEIGSRFGPATSLRLEFVVDPEDDPPSGYLSLGIRTVLDDDHAYEQLDRLDEEWWIDAIRDSQGLLTIDIARQ